MAIRIIRIDDLDGTDGAEAITLELDNKSYEIDLGPRNRARLHRVISPFIERARPLDTNEKSTATEINEPSESRRDDTHLGDVLEAGGHTKSTLKSLDLIEMTQEVQD